MEPTQQNHPNEETQNGSSGGGSGGAKGSFLCRQTSTRWTPTTDQIRILKDLYYTKGIRSPNADQIQRISARLRQYGKIEGKNVFYWFQNHKARERQKRRFTSDHHLVSPPPTQQHQQQQQQLTRSSSGGSGIITTVASSTTSAAANWKPEQEYFFLNHKFPGNDTFSPGFSAASSSSSAGVLTVGQMGNYGYGTLPMEKSFRDCSIGGSISQNYGWISGKSNTHELYRPSYSFYDQKPKPGHYSEDLEEEEEQEAGEEDQEEEEEEEGCEVETLPLFPVQREDFNIGGYCSNVKNSNPNYYYSNAGNCTSLELSLNSFFSQSPDL